MRYLKLIVAYDGADFFGWQWQPKQRTVQGEFEAAIRAVTGEETRVSASGRTDTGVHAIGQVVGWATESDLATDVLLRALNANTPRDLAVKEVVEVREGFNPILDSTSKRYRYLLYDNSVRDVFSRNSVWQVWHRLNDNAMREAAPALLGEHDFKGYETAGSPRVTTVREVYDLQVERRQFENGERIVIEVEASGFLYNMVRNIVGTLVQIGRGKEPITFAADVLAAKDRAIAGPTAPPQGLYLLKVNYADDAS
ncbi:MAG: tRNA pseudouridine(38-40) synthase TruA [Planctomycetaceae bacterium]|nr:tRNA pseudouridine(38-40) synthase TruA [Planctomycetaceae bacterium]